MKCWNESLVLSENGRGGIKPQCDVGGLSGRMLIPKWKLEHYFIPSSITMKLTYSDIGYTNRSPWPEGMIVTSSTFEKGLAIK